MNWLVSMGLVNAVLATALAAFAFLIGRYSRWPALAHDTVARAGSTIA